MRVFRHFGSLNDVHSFLAVRNKRLTLLALDGSFSTAQYFALGQWDRQQEVMVPVAIIKKDEQGLVLAGDL